MTDTELLPPHQHQLAHNAMLSLGKNMLGDGPAQYAVLALAVRLAEVGIEPIEEFKTAAMLCLKRAVETGEMPSKRKPGGESFGDDAKSFEIATTYWIEYYLRGKFKSNQRTMEICGCNNTVQVSKSVKRYGIIAQVSALRDLAMGNESGPDPQWWKVWLELRNEIDAGKHYRTKPKGASSHEWVWHKR